jgi:UTP-glucose-1-phosphate uridylyltransferase
MHALTGSGPKELLLIEGEPLVVRAVREAVAAGLARCVIVLAPGKASLRQAVENTELPGCIDVEYVLQPEPRGEADALARCRPIVGDAPVAVIYPDNVHTPRPGALAALMTAWSPERPHLLGLMEVRPELEATISDSGRIDLGGPEADDIRPILDFLPKGPGHFVRRRPGELRTCGIYLAGGDYMTSIREALARFPQGEVSDGMVRRLMLERGARFWGLRLPGTVHDVGNPAGYAACRRQMGESERP